MISHLVKAEGFEKKTNVNKHILYIYKSMYTQLQHHYKEIEIFCSVFLAVLFFTSTV